MTGILSKNPSYLLCNRPISLTELEGELKVLFCIKGRLQTQVSTYQWLKLVTYSLSVMMFKITKIYLTISVTLVLFICYFNK